MSPTSYQTAPPRGGPSTLANDLRDRPSEPPTVTGWTVPASTNCPPPRMAPPHLRRRRPRRPASPATPSGAARWSPGERRGALSTIAADPAGLPVRLGRQLRPRRPRRPAVLRQHDGRAHPERAARSAASLLVTEPVPDGADPLASGRVTLLGLIAPVDDERARRRARPLPRGQPGGGVLHRLRRLHVPIASTSTHIRYVGGYGRMSWVDAAEYAAAEADPAGRRRGRDHRAHERRPRRRAGPVLPPLRRAWPTRRRRRCRPSTATASTWSPSAAERRTPVRLAFPEECTTGDEVRQAMVAMVAEARSASA